MESEVVGLTDIVMFEETYATKPRIEPGTVEMNPPVIDHWSLRIKKNGPCFTYQNNHHHMGTQGMLRIGLNTSFKHQIFVHDPRFFINSANPAVTVGSIFLPPG